MILLLLLPRERDLECMVGGVGAQLHDDRMQAFGWGLWCRAQLSVERRYFVVVLGESFSLAERQLH